MDFLCRNRFTKPKGSFEQGVIEALRTRVLDIVSPVSGGLLFLSGMDHAPLQAQARMHDGMITPQPARRSRLRALFRYAVIVLVLLAAGLFFARRQIGNALARELDARLSAAGVFIEWQSADWVPGPGIRLHGLAVYRDAEKSDRIALIGNVTAIKGNREWNQWDRVSVHMKEAMLTLGRGDEETTLEDVDKASFYQRMNAAIARWNARMVLTCKREIEVLMEHGAQEGG